MLVVTKLAWPLNLRDWRSVDYLFFAFTFCKNFSKQTFLSTQFLTGQQIYLQISVSRWLLPTNIFQLLHQIETFAKTAWQIHLNIFSYWIYRFLDALASLRSHWRIEWSHFSDLRITSESIKNIVSDRFNSVNRQCKHCQLCQHCRHC